MIDPMEAAHQVITDAVARLSVQALLPPVWRPVADLPKQGKILARCWHKGITKHSIPGCWSHPILYTWDPSHDYWGARREGMCIRPDSEHRFVGFIYPEDPPARDDL